MPKGTAQVIFECPESFRRRLYEEKLKRRMSIKQLIMEAVEELWFSSAAEQEIASRLAWMSHPHHTDDEKSGLGVGEVTEGEIISIHLPPPEPDEREHWAEMFVEYMERCPPEKVKLLQSVIKEDLKIYKSRKASRKRNKSAAAEQGKRRMAKEKQ